MSILIKRAKVVDSQSKHNGKTVDILIEKGKITKIGKNIKSKARTIELKNLHVSQGWFDFRANLKDPGEEYKEDLTSGAQAAIRGGFTGVACSSATSPSINSKSDVEYIVNKAKNIGLEILPYGNLTQDQDGKNISEMYDMHLAGAIGFTDDKKSIANADLLKTALLYTQNFDALVSVFANDENISNKGKMNEGKVSTELGLRGIPALSESIAISRDLHVLNYTGGNLHFNCLSSKDSVKLIEEAQKQKLNVSCDIAAHQLSFTDSDLSDFDTNLKVLPPMRTKKDNDEIIKALKANVIQVICSDHMPEDAEAKQVEFDQAAFGISSLETTFAAANTVLEGKLELDHIIDKLTVNPRTLLGLSSETIEEGSNANITLFDPKLKWEVNSADWKSKSKNSPYFGKTLTGKALGIVVGSKVMLNF